MGDWIICPECNGSGWQDKTIEYREGQPYHYVDPCWKCRGVKEIFQESKCHDGER